MAAHSILNYFLEYNDVVDVVHRFEIYTRDYSVYHNGVQVTHDGVDVVHGGDNSGVLGKEIQGRVFLDYGRVTDTLESIRGMGLRVELEADQTLTFSDLYSENQKTYGVIYYRNGVIKFTGWINPEGWFEDFVNEKWMVSFDCLDGLSYLKDLSFVEDATGLPFVGKKTQLDLISKALLRTGLEQNINVDIQIFYTGLADTVNILENVYANTIRFIKDDGETITPCEDVLKDILEPYGACIASVDGEWFIFKPNQLFNNNLMNYFRYDYLGVALSPTTGMRNTALTIGSELDGFSPHHCSGNQAIKNLNSIGAYRISYKYGSLVSLLDNTKLCSVGAVIADWTILSGTYLTYPIPPGSCGIIVEVAESTQWEQVIETDVITIAIGDKIKFTSNIAYQGDASYLSNYVYEVQLTDGSDTYYLQTDSAWSMNNPKLITYRTLNNGNYIAELLADAAPIAGSMKMIIHTGRNKPISTPFVIHQISQVTITNETEDSSRIIKGEFHTVERTTNPNAKVKSVKEVLTGDNESETYVGALYKADQNTTTSTWFRKGISEAFEILRIMGEETLRAHASTSRVFSGDVFGYFSYLSIVTINGLPGLFIVTKYNYDTYNNIISAEFTQMYGLELTDIDYQLTFDYGNVVEPTIKG